MREDRIAPKLSKADTVALWHAVDAYAYSVRAMSDIDGITPETLGAERSRLLAAKRALRKVNAIRKAKFPILTGGGQ